jgi:hypothetical protein
VNNRFLKFLLGFTILWAAVLLGIYLTQSEAQAYMMMMYAFVGGIGFYAVAAALWLMATARKQEARELSFLKALLAILLLALPVLGIWYGYTH